MAITFPPQLNSCPLVDSFAISVGNRVKRSSQEAGPVKVRRMAGKVPDVVSAVILLESYEQVTILQNWVEDTRAGLAGGVRCFEWVHPKTNKAILCRLVPSSDEALFTIEPYQGSSRVWAAQLVFEIMP